MGICSLFVVVIVGSVHLWICDFIMFLTGFDYVFLSLLLQLTVDVLVSKFEDDGNPKKENVCKLLAISL